MLRSSLDTAALQGRNANFLGREWYRKYFESSLSIPSPEFDILQNCAKENNVNLSVGIIEKEGGTLYCTAVLIGKGGNLLSRHRKVSFVPLTFEILLMPI